MGSKLRRVYDAPQTPLERVAASSQANRVRVAELKNWMKSLNPFALGKTIDQKLERIYELANRRLSPKVPKELPLPKQSKSSRRKGGGRDARSASMEITKRFPLSHRGDDGGAPSPLATLQMARRCAVRLQGLDVEANIGSASTPRGNVFLDIACCYEIPVVVVVDFYFIEHFKNGSTGDEN